MRMCNPNMFAIRYGWQMEVNERFASRSNVTSAIIQPSRKNFRFEAPMQQSNQTLWWSSSGMPIWHVLHWYTRPQLLLAASTSLGSINFSDDPFVSVGGSRFSMLPSVEISFGTPVGQYDLLYACDFVCKLKYVTNYSKEQQV